MAAKVNLKDILKFDVQTPEFEIGTVPIMHLANREKAYFEKFMPVALSAIVIGFRVNVISDWTWFACNENGERCDADESCQELCLKIEDALKLQGFNTKIVPYPGESGLQFRYVAFSAGLGEIGKNAFLLHREWGSWIHLRVLATEAAFEMISRPSDSVCIDCDECIQVCPAKSIMEDSFEGLACRSYRKSIGEYEPVGPQRELRYCLLCALACPVGKIPQH